MPLLLGQGTHAIHKIQRRSKVRKLESPRDVMFINDLPIGQLVAEFVKLCPMKCGHPASARHAVLISKGSHNREV